MPDRYRGRRRECLGRSLQVGTNGIATFTQSSGTLTVGAGINDTLDIGFNIGNMIATSGTMNLAGLSQLTANVDQVRVGAASAGQSGQGTLMLGINSDINAGTQVVVGSTPGGSGNSGVTSSLVFGSGVTNVATRSFIVGGDKSRGNATVAAGGIVNLNGFAANTMDLLVGNYLNTATVGAASTFDMTGGTLNASLNVLAVGQKTGGNTGGTIGILTLAPGSHVISANSMVIGRVDGNTSLAVATAGTVNFGGGTLLVNNDIAVGSWTNNAGTPTATGTLNITGGIVTVGGNITTTNSANANSTLTLNGGTLDMTGGTINVDTFNAQAGTLDDVAGLFAGDGTTPAALTKTTAGTLTLTGLQNYATLNTNAGITELDAALGTGTSTINANAGTTNISVSQTLAALNIGAGAVVTLEADPGPAPAGAELGVVNYDSGQTLTPLNIGDGNTVTLGTGPEAAAAIEAVPEPGAFGLLALGALGILGRRRREQRTAARD